MDILGKGSKPVVYKSNIRLQFYGTTVDDCRINIDHIYAKLMPDELVVVYGDYTIFLLYSYTTNKSQVVHITESKNVKFSEDITCHLPKDVSIESLNPQVSFEPHVSFTRASVNVYSWNIEIEGEFNVDIHGDKNNEEDKPFINDTNLAGNATVMQLSNLGIPADQLLDMDVHSINRLIAGRDENTLPPQTTADSWQTPHKNDEPPSLVPPENSQEKQ